MPELGLNRPKKVLIAIPCRDEWKASTAMCFGHMNAHNATLPFAFAALERRGAMIGPQRNFIAEEALKIGADYIFWMDSDMTFPPDIIKRLLAHNLPFVGATYNKRVAPYETLGHFLDLEQDLSRGGLAPVDRMPFGLMLTSTELFRTIPGPWFFESYRWPGSSPLDAFLKMIDDLSMVEMPDSVRSGIHDVKGIREWLEANDRSWGPNHKLYSEDYNFCRKALRAGYKIFCDLDLSAQCGHIGEQVVTLQLPNAKVKEVQNG
jgi:hypothetical protein